MRKRIGVAILFLLCVVVFILTNSGRFLGSNGLGNNVLRGKLRSFSPDKNGIIVVSASGRIMSQAKEVELEISNYLETPVTTGESYTIQMNNNGLWETIDFGVHFLSQGIIIRSNQSQKFHCNLYQDRHQYSSGHYRILKEIVKHGGEVYFVSFEFDLVSPLLTKLP